MKNKALYRYNRVPCNNHTIDVLSEHVHVKNDTDYYERKR